MSYAGYTVVETYPKIVVALMKQDFFLYTMHPIHVKWVGIQDCAQTDKTVATSEAVLPTYGFQSHKRKERMQIL